MPSSTVAAPCSTVYMFLELPGGCPPCCLPEVQIHEVHGGVGDNGPKRCSSVHLFFYAYLQKQFPRGYNILLVIVDLFCSLSILPILKRPESGQGEMERRGGRRGGGGEWTQLPFIIMYFLFGNIKDYVYIKDYVNTSTVFPYSSVVPMGWCSPSPTSTVLGNCLVSEVSEEKVTPGLPFILTLSFSS